MTNSPKKLITTRLVSDLNRRILLLVVTCFSLLIFFSISSVASNATLNTISSFAPFKSIFSNRTPQQSDLLLNSTPPQDRVPARDKARKERLNVSRIAVYLVGGASRFELTGQLVMEKILNEYLNSDLFLHSPLDQNAFKILFVEDRAQDRSGSKLPAQTDSRNRIAASSPHRADLTKQDPGSFAIFQSGRRVSYDDQRVSEGGEFHIQLKIQTRADGYRNAPLGPEYFASGKYVVPAGSNYGGLNDWFGVGDLNTTTVALSRVALVPQPDSSGFRQLNSETAFRAQLTTQGIPCLTKRIPFCVVSNRRYGFPPE